MSTSIKLAIENAINCIIEENSKDKTGDDVIEGWSIESVFILRWWSNPISEMLLYCWIVCLQESSESFAENPTHIYETTGITLLN